MPLAHLPHRRHAHALRTSAPTAATGATDVERLVITLFNPSTEPLALTLRINDVAHDRSEHAYNDRYNTRLILEPGFNTFTRNLADIENAPADRTMDMSQIRRMGLFAVRLPEPRTVYLSDLRLD